MRSLLIYGNSGCESGRTSTRVERTQIAAKRIDVRQTRAQFFFFFFIFLVGYVEERPW